MPLEPGLSGEATLLVARDDTAQIVGTGDVPVLSTARIVAVCEQAAVQATSLALPPGMTTVGAAVQVTHVAPSAVGTIVRAEAVLERVEGRRLHFTVTVTDDRGLLAAGKLTRAVVERDRFLAKLDRQ